MHGYEFSVTRLGDFWKFLLKNILKQVVQISGEFRANCFWKPLLFKQKQMLLFFGQLLETFGPLLISTSGHTGYDAFTCSNVSYMVLSVASPVSLASNRSATPIIDAKKKF